MTIRTKLTLLCGLSLVTVAGFSASAYFATKQVAAGTQESVTFTSAMRNQMMADMMHDAIRAGGAEVAMDLFRGMLSDGINRLEVTIS